ncbi:MAG: hypothetical protein F9K45_03470 [Melioribacteraceae bacterium]|nr:MAG: hypothetical protein F9K45_03470 [Melioribacteraceae bacterium]
MALAEISAALQSIKVASDIAKGIKSLKTEVAINEKASELLDSIIDVKMNLIEFQNHYENVQREKRELEEKIRSYENWESIQKQYALKEISKGIFAYSFSIEDKEIPHHFLCANCFEGRVKSIIQMDWQDDYQTKYSCPKCKNHVITQHGRRGNNY